MNTKLKNVAWVSLAGYYAIFVSLIKNFVFAYIFTTSDYAKVQSYILYAGYSWVFLMGFTDGILIKYGNFDYNMIPKAKFRTFTVLMCRFQFFCLLAISFIGIISGNSFAYINIAIGIFLSNLCAYFSVINQFTCHFSDDSIAMFIWNTVIVIFVVAMIFFKQTNYIFAIIGLNLSNLIYLIVLCLQNQALILGDRMTIKSILPEVFMLIKTGFFVMISVTVGRIIMSVDKVFVDNLFSELNFANYAFSVSVMTMFFSVINSSSKVIFPYLKRLNSENSSKYYCSLSDIITSISCILCVAFFAIRPLINLIIPKYNGAILYLGILFPCVIFKIVFNMISDNFYKLLNCVREYTYNGMFALMGAVLTDLIAYLIFKSVEAIAFASVLTFVIWYIINEAFFINRLRLMLTDVIKKYIMIIISLGVFFFCNINVKNSMIGGLTYLLCDLLLVCALYFKKFSCCICRINGQINGEARDKRIN